MAATEILLAGFGGQGVLFAGKILAYCGLMDNKELSWLPSYGPEMRGGTANCSVCISDEPIGSPLVLAPDILIAMNQPSFEKFLPKVRSGGVVVYDSSLISSPETGREDIRVCGVPATALANENGFPKLANCIMLGYFVKVTGLFDFAFFQNVLRASAPKAKAELGELNAKAFEIGYAYGG